MWHSFENKDSFEAWRTYIGNGCEILEQGVSERRAIKLCSSKENQHAIIKTRMGVLTREMIDLDHDFSQLFLSHNKEEVENMADRIEILANYIRCVVHEIRKNFYILNKK
ncbi:MAG: hypothetical protein Q8L47_01370 [bacterium]|nr:hypothetical protein [bacterium]